ncbi:MAG: hypothetical protein JSS72_04085 [Armatimonadetes bacterium]|nr:hypothetical protein [Armatimonadota bacterium]
MNLKKGIIYGSIGLVVLILILVGVPLAMVGSDMSQMDSMLKTEVANHTDQDALQQKLTGMGYTVNPNGTLTGPRHTTGLYSTWLVLKLGFNEDKKNTSYRIDRDGGLF